MPPEYLFCVPGEHLGSFKKRLSAAERIILLLDYDGTLTPICKTPALALLSEEMKQLLESLSCIDSITVALVTGRSYKDIRKVAGLKDVIYVSNHGFQITRRRSHWIHPELKSVIKLLQDLSLLLKEALSRFYLTVLENKKFTLTIHYRSEKKINVPLVNKTVKSIVSSYIAQLKVTKGKKVIEVRPRISWNKGLAAVKLLSMLKSKKDTFVIYIGDDKTDEDAFVALSERAATVRVGPGRFTNAQYYVKNVNEVRSLLKMILSERSIIKKTN